MEALERVPLCEVKIDQNESKSSGSAKMQRSVCVM